MGWADGDAYVEALIEVGDVALTSADCGPEYMTVRGLDRGGRAAVFFG